MFALTGKKVHYQVKHHLMKTLTTESHLRILGSCCCFYLEANFRNSPALQPQFPLVYETFGGREDSAWLVRCLTIGRYAITETLTAACSPSCAAWLLVLSQRYHPCGESPMDFPEHTMPTLPSNGISPPEDPSGPNTD